MIKKNLLVYCVLGAVFILESVFLYFTIYRASYFTVTGIGKITFWTLFVELFLIIGFAAFFAIKSWNKIKINKKIVLLLVGLAVIAIFLRMKQPLLHGHFFDEDIYLHEAQMMAINHTANSCLNGWFDASGLQCALYNDMPALKQGYPLMLSVIFSLLGVMNENIAFGFNLVVSVLTIYLVFFIGREIWSPISGWFAAIILTVLPFHIYWSISTSSDLPGLFFLLSAVLSFIVYLKNEKPETLLFSGFLLSYAAAIRGGEYLLLAPVFFLPLLIGQNKLSRFLSNRFHVVLLVLLTLFFTWNIASVTLSVGAYSNTLSAFGHQYLASSKSFFENLKMMISYHRTIGDLITMALACLGPVGFYLLWRRNRKAAIYFGLIAALMFLFYSAFAFGGYSQIHQISNSRFALIWLSLGAVFAGIALDFAVNLSAKKNLLVFAFSFASVFYIHQNFSELITNRSGDIFHKEAADNLSFEKQHPDCLYVAFIPAQELFHGYSAMSYDWLTAHSLPENQCIIFLESSVCKDLSSCTSLKERYSWVPAADNIWQLQR